MNATNDGKEAPRILRIAREFVTEIRADLERAAWEGADLPPRLRTVHDRAGHSSPEFRTLAVPLPSHVGGASPTILSGAIARYTVRRPPTCLLLCLDVMGTNERGEPQPIFIAEARDRAGARLFFAQPFDSADGRIQWHDPIDGGWRDPGEDEMIIDAAFEV